MQYMQFQNISDLSSDVQGIFRLITSSTRARRKRTTHQRKRENTRGRGVGKEIDASAPFGLGEFPPRKGFSMLPWSHRPDLPNVFPSKPGIRSGIKPKRLSPSQRLAFRTIWFATKERAYDLWSLVLPIFLVMGVLVLSARFWCWAVGW